MNKSVLVDFDQCVCDVQRHVLDLAFRERLVLHERGCGRTQQLRETQHVPGRDGRPDGRQKSPARRALQEFNLGFELIGEGFSVALIAVGVFFY